MSLHGCANCLLTVSYSGGPDHSDSPPPGRPFHPSFEQLEPARGARNVAIYPDLRPEPTPLPTHLPPEDEAYVDEILTKRGTLSKTGREQVADKDITRLRPHQWLNDEIINFYGQLILSRSESHRGKSTSTPLSVALTASLTVSRARARARARARHWGQGNLEPVITC